MASSAKLTGRARGELERFARIPESVMESPALKTAPPTTYKVLAALVVGKVKELNGTLCLSASHAKRYGINSHDTLSRTLELLRERGLIEVTRRAPRMKKWPTLYAVTWWPIYSRNGQPLEVPEKESRAFEAWTPTESDLEKNPRPGERDTFVPMAGIKTPRHRPDFTPRDLHSSSRPSGASRGLGGSRRSRA